MNVDIPPLQNGKNIGSSTAAIPGTDTSVAWAISCARSASSSHFVLGWICTMPARIPFCQCDAAGGKVKVVLVNLTDNGGGQKDVCAETGRLE
jgi:hypothetical protein